MAAGAGEHRAPAEFTDVQKRYPKKVMNMDVFAKLGPTELNDRTRVVVFGPNAAIDCIQKGAHYRCKMIWMINTTPDKLPILATQPLVRSWVDSNLDKIFTYESFQFPMMASNDIRIQATNKKETRNFGADYVVYGLGQTGEPVKAIDIPIQATLKPIYDLNNYLGGGNNTILGYEAEGTTLQSGFEVIGALTAQVGRAIQGDRVKSLKEQISIIRNVEQFILAISNARFPVKKPFLLKDPDFLANQPYGPLKAQLQAEADWVSKSNTTNVGVAEGIQNIVSVLLAYYAAKNYAKLINQAAQDLPKGTVADGGQITTIKSAMAAKHSTVPKYLPSQNYTTPGLTTASVKGEENWIPVKSNAGDVNFQTDNATMLQIGLCQMYPFIPDNKLNNWISQFMVKRHNTGIGFNTTQLTQLHLELKSLNNNALQKLSLNN